MAVAIAALAAPSGAQCPPDTLLSTLVNPLPSSSDPYADHFGEAVAISGNLAVVGSPHDDPAAPMWMNSGAAYVFDVTTGARLSTLINPAPESFDPSGGMGEPGFDDIFGAAVAISGNLAVVGAPFDDPGEIVSAGSAYIFDARSGALLWTLTHPGAAQKGDNFGGAVAISGNLAVVSASGDDVGGTANAGTVFVFDATTGALVATLNKPSPARLDHFGASVGISGNLVAVGVSSGEADGGAAAYVFDATTGALTATLTNPTPTDWDWFGRSVAISGSLAVVGALGADPGGMTGAGAAYVFDAASGALLSTLAKPAPAARDDFGSSVAISGNLAIISAPDDDPGGVADAGGVYVFNATTGALAATLSSPSPSADGEFGESVAISGARALVGASHEDVQTPTDNAGKAYVFACGSLSALTAVQQWAEYE